MKFSAIFLSLCALPVAAFPALADPSPDLSLQKAEQIAQAAAKTISAQQIGGAIAVVDAQGHLVLFERLDGATLANGELAQDKAMTAVRFGRPTQAFADQLADGNLTVLGNPLVTPLPGGVPILQGDTVVGAIGVSTPEGALDPVAAQAGVAEM